MGENFKFAFREKHWRSAEQFGHTKDYMLKEDLLLATVAELSRCEELSTVGTVKELYAQNRLIRNSIDAYRARTLH